MKKIGNGNHGRFQTSVIVTTYNVEPYITQTIKSLANQTIDPDSFEVIFVDDCSKDGGLEIVSNESGAIKNHKILSTPINLGAAGAKNIGIQMASAPRIMLLDGDDWYEPGAIERTMAFMKEHPSIRYSYSEYKRVNDSGEFICDCEGKPFSREGMLGRNLVGAVECFDKKLFKELGGFRYTFVEDYDFALRASEHLGEGEIALNPQVLYNYRVRANNKSNGALALVRQSASDSIKQSIKRKEGFDAEVFFDRKNGHNYYRWQPL